MGIKKTNHRLSKASTERARLMPASAARKPAVSLREIASSPVKRLSSYPSPSPEKLSPSSPDKNMVSKSSPANKKKVAFSKALILTPMVSRTPRKSILKASSKPVTVSSQDQFLASPTKNTTDNSPNKEDFWLPGQIAKLPPSMNNVQDQLLSFKSLICGGLAVLDNVNSTKRFEVYATLSLLLKDLKDGRKLSILLCYIDDLTRIVKRDLINLDKEIPTKPADETLPIDAEASKLSAKDPFKTRIHVQITKLLSILLSNPSIVSNYWKCNAENLTFFKWIIQYSCSIIVKQSTSKNLLIANLQLLKDHKLSSSIPLPLQEKILYAILNFKTFNNSTSLIIEKLNILKQLVLNFSLMMEKNCKSWVSYFFKCFLDSISNHQRKPLQASTSLLLESCSQYLSSKSLNFEISSVLKSDLPSHYNTQESSIPITQSVFSYITKRLLDLLNIDSCELIMLTWLGITLAFFSFPENLPQLSKEWLSVNLSCLMLSDGPDGYRAEIAAINSWKSVLYVLSNSDRVISDMGIFKILSPLSYKKRTYEITKEHEDAIVQLFVRFTFAITCHKGSHGDQISRASDLKRLLSHLYEMKDKHEGLSKLSNELLPQLLQNRSANENRGNPNGLYIVLQTEAVVISQIEPISPLVLFRDHETFMRMFKEQIWSNENIHSKIKLSALSGIMAKTKMILNNKSLMERSKFIEETDAILVQYQDFIGEYTARVEELKDSFSKIEYFNRLTILLKTNLGNRILDSKFSFYEELVSRATIYEGIKATDVLKFIIQQNRNSEYLILEKIFNRFYLQDNEPRNPENAQIIQFIGNNLESKIFMNDLNEPEIKSILNILLHFPSKSPTLLANIISMLLTNENRIVNNVEYFIDLLDLRNWSMGNLFNLINCIDMIKGPSSKKSALEKTIIQKIQNEMQINFKESYSLSFFEHLITLKINKLGDFSTLFYLTNHEYFFYHLIDLKKQYPLDVFPKLFVLFQQYLSKLEMKTYRENILPWNQIDSILSHGLKLCVNLNSNLAKNQHDLKVDDFPLLERISTVYKSIFTILNRIDDTSYSRLKLVNEFFKSRFSIEGRDQQKLQNAMKTCGKLHISVPNQTADKRQEDEAPFQSPQETTRVENDSLGERATQVISSIENGIFREEPTQAIDFRASPVESQVSQELVDDTSDNPTQAIPENHFNVMSQETIQNDDTNKEKIEVACTASFIVPEKDTKRVRRQAGSSQTAKSTFFPNRLLKNGRKKLQERIIESSVEPVGFDLNQDVNSDDMDDITMISQEEFIESQKDASADEERDNPNDDNSIHSSFEDAYDVESSVESNSGNDDKNVDHTFVKIPLLELNNEADKNSSTQDDINNQDESAFPEVNQDGTVEIEDSNSPLKEFNKSLSQSDSSLEATVPEITEQENKEEQVGSEDNDDDFNELILVSNSQTREINIDVPFSYAALDSSPLRQKKIRKTHSVGRITPLRESPVPLSPKEASVNENVQDSIQVTKRRMQDSSSFLSSPTKRIRNNGNPNQMISQHESGTVEFCGAPDSSPEAEVLSKNDPSVARFRLIERAVGLISDADSECFESLSNKDVYDMETKLMRLMIRLRESRTNRSK